MKHNLSEKQIQMMQAALENAKDINCECGGSIFAQGSKLKRLSRILTGEDKDSVLPIPTLYCVSCFKEITFEAEPKVIA